LLASLFFSCAFAFFHLNLIRESAVLHVLWELIRQHLIADINPSTFPELVVLRGANESDADWNMLTPEDFLLRWLSYHLNALALGTDSLDGVSESQLPFNLTNFGNSLKVILFESLEFIKMNNPV
jgi:hypothetical protein